MSSRQTSIQDFFRSDRPANPELSNRNSAPPTTGRIRQERSGEAHLQGNGDRFNNLFRATGNTAGRHSNIDPALSVGVPDRLTGLPAGARSTVTSAGLSTVEVARALGVPPGASTVEIDRELTKDKDPPVPGAALVTTVSSDSGEDIIITGPFFPLRFFFIKFL